MTTSELIAERYDRMAQSWALRNSATSTNPKSVPGLEYANEVMQHKYALYTKTRYVSEVDEHERADKCPTCAEHDSNVQNVDAERPPARISETQHLWIFGAMSVFGCFAMVYTGPFPLNVIFGAAALVPFSHALVKKLRRRRKMGRDAL